MGHLSRNVWMLMLAGALTLCVAPMVVFIGGIIGAQLASAPGLSTLPVAAMVVGTACAVIPVSKLMARFGRKRVFVSGACYNALCAIIAAIALDKQSFWGFTCATFGLGMGLAVIQQYRFAAMESVHGDYAGQAASTVLIGGLLAAFLGPELAHAGREISSTLFLGSFLLLAGVSVMGAGLLCLYRDRVEINSADLMVEQRPLRQIISQDVFWVAMLAAAVGYAVMSYIMTATPVSMHHMQGHSLVDTKWVIQSHILAMYIPSFFSGRLIDRYGARQVMVAGLLIYCVCVVLTLMGQELMHYWLGLIALGLGWNLLFVSGTALLAESHTSGERYKVQGLNDFMVFGFQAIAALASGVVVFDFGWMILIYSVIPLLLLQLGVMIWENGREEKGRAKSL